MCFVSSAMCHEVGKTYIFSYQCFGLREGGSYRRILAPAPPEYSGAGASFVLPKASEKSFERLIARVAFLLPDRSFLLLSFAYACLSFKLLNVIETHKKTHTHTNTHTQIRKATKKRNNPPYTAIMHRLRQNAHTKLAGQTHNTAKRALINT